MNDVEPVGLEHLHALVEVPQNRTVLVELVIVRRVGRDVETGQRSQVLALFEIVFKLFILVHVHGYFGQVDAVLFQHGLTFHKSLYHGLPHCGGHGPPVAVSLYRSRPHEPR